MNPDHIVLSVIQRIEFRLDKKETISVNEVANISGFSKRYIQKIFKERVQMPISTYIRKRRLTQAAILIKLTKKSLYHISMDLNFSTQQSFTRSFYREFRLTPLQFRMSDGFDCSKLLPNYALKLNNYKIEKIKMGLLRLKTESFNFKERLLDSSAKRANKFRFDEINLILSEKDEAIVVTTFKPGSKLEHEIILNANIGYEDCINFNLEIKPMLCWEITFTGLWDDYVIFGRMFIFELKIKIQNHFIEKITINSSKKNNTIYNVKIYIPIN
ncbi:TPA: helix-turn-helix domain-containing protein [Escherichia coli]|nr:helix-turn-helix domain-containing protein [Escherichia coli]HAZ3600598.1 helix-turn-helix domain-containing protein [Escherichia coli]